LAADPDDAGIARETLLPMSILLLEVMEVTQRALPYRRIAD